ncbi:hypothetical protein QBC32DRAFT_313011 [Pseudoneurospora amorphoporcata]|uniref:Uncharacterized protein n=1 Tax=Pseudoneurospora amorphoporcata TaxID=241081 RepID=A0AAN6NWT1_9PEZI|nr:hypothetical protein QBC32DRAFT_313011 [Pseudoneurospora amorphoporcata]
MNSISGPRAKAWFTSLPTSSPASDPEPAANSPKSSTSGYSHANFASSSSPNSTKPDNECSSDDDCFITAIQVRRRQNPVQEIPKTEKAEDEEPFGGRFAARAKDSRGKEDNSHATKPFPTASPISSTKGNKLAPSDAENNNCNGIFRPNAYGSNHEEVNGAEGAVNLSTSQTANSTHRNGTHIARHSRETPSIFGDGSSKRPLVIQDIETSSPSGSVEIAKRRRLSIDRHQSGGYDQVFSKDQPQPFRRETASSHSRHRTPLKPLGNNFGSFTRPSSNLDVEKSNEVAKAINNPPTTAGVKATEELHQIKEQAKEATISKPTKEEVPQDSAKAPIASLLGNKNAIDQTDTIVASGSQQNKATQSKLVGKAASNPTNTIVPPRSQPTKDTRGTQGDKNPASSLPATHRSAQATQSSLSKEEPSQLHYEETDADLYKRSESKQQQTKTARFINRLPIGEERTGYKFTAPRASNGFQQPPKEDGRPVRPPPAPRRKKTEIASSSKNPPAPTTNIAACPRTLPPAPPSRLYPPAAPPAPTKKAVPAQLGLSPTDPILQYVIKHTRKHPISESDSTRHYRSTEYLSKQEANEACRQRLQKMTNPNSNPHPFQAVDQRYGNKDLFQGTITYRDGGVQLYYVDEEEVMLGDLVEKRELSLDEKGLEIYSKSMWLVWAVRYYPREEEEEEQRLLGTGEQVVEVVEEGNEADDEDDGEEEEDLFGDKDIDGQLNEEITDLEVGEAQERTKESRVSATEGVDKADEADTLATSENLTDSGVQTNTDGSQTEGRQTQTQTELGLQTQQYITSNSQSQSNQALVGEQTQTTIQGHQGLEGGSEEARPEPHTPPDSQKQQPQPQPPNTQRPPTPPLPCDLYSPMPSSTEYSSSSDSDSERASLTTRRSLPNNIPPPPSPLPAFSVLKPESSDHGTFTTLRFANLEALEVFKALTKPETPARMSDVLYWREEVVPEVEARFREWSYDGKEREEGMEGREKGEYGSGIDERLFSVEWEPDAQRYKWPFRRVEVRVKELKLQGPKDLGGLEVKAPPSGSSRNSGTLIRSNTGGGSGAAALGFAASTTSTSGAATNGNAEADAAGTMATTSRAAKGTARVKVKVTATATASKTSTPNNDLAAQHKHYEDARAVLNAKKEKNKRPRPTRQEKGKGKAVDPVTTTETQDNGKEAGKGVLNVWAEELGVREEGQCSEEE